MDVGRTDLDIVEELKLRTWARKNYVPDLQRDIDWHPVILEEMSRRDCEVQLISDHVGTEDRPHNDTKNAHGKSPKFLKRFRLHALAAAIRG